MNESKPLQFTLRRLFGLTAVAALLMWAGVNLLLVASILVYLATVAAFYLLVAVVAAGAFFTVEAAESACRGIFRAVHCRVRR